jgi:hypothetical protein
MLKLKTHKGSHLIQTATRLRDRDKMINDGIPVAYRSRPLSLLYCSLSGWHEGRRYGYFWVLCFHCYGDLSCGEVVRSDMSRSLLCLHSGSVLCVLARFPFREGGIRFVGQWLWSERLFWNGHYRLNCCCYCLSVMMALRIGDQHESVSLMQVLGVEAEVDRNGYGGRCGHDARREGHRL